MKYISIDDLEVYKLAMDIGEEIWVIVDNWTEFAKKVLGEQFCRAGDSIAANIAEGHGRYHFKEKKNFCFYARGSLLESKTWLRKAYNRKLVDKEVFDKVFEQLSKCHYLLNQYIKSFNPPGGSNDIVREPESPAYSLPDNFDDFTDF